MKSSLRFAVVYNLPDDILEQIFSRLPAKSVGKLRCLSKTWRIRLSSTEFIDFHLLHRDHEENLILTGDLSAFCKLKDDYLAREIKLPPHRGVKVVGYCQGLVLLDDILVNYANKKFYLLNPVTKQCLTIPYTPVHHLDASKGVRMNGFGYVDGQYKIVSLSPGKTSNTSCAVSVYSSKKGVWEELGPSPYGHSTRSRVSTGVFLNGAIHWFGRTRRTSSNHMIIAAFDLAGEVFNEISIPTDFSTEDNYYYWWRFGGPFALRGCLCMVDDQNLGGEKWATNIWTMKEYGIAKSWTKLISMEEYIINPLFFTGIDHQMIVYHQSDYKKTVLAVYNLQEKQSSTVKVDGGPYPIRYIHTFVESLVSPNQVVPARCTQQE